MLRNAGISGRISRPIIAADPTSTVEIAKTSGAAANSRQRKTHAKNTASVVQANTRVNS